MAQRGRYHTHKHSWRSTLSVPFLLITLFAFGLMSIYALTHYLLTEDKKTLISNNLGTIATYLHIYDPQSANLVANIDTLINAYHDRKNIFATHKQTLDTIRTQIGSQASDFLKHNPQYSTLVNFLNDVEPHSEELMLYLGANTPKSYLVILQNSAEKRPNGGFFGSFAYIRILHGRIRTIHIIDSYLGFRTMPWVKIKPPRRSDPIYDGVPFGWIAANKFGFTNIDGDHLIQLYNKTFNSPESDSHIPAAICKDICHRQIDGVIFVQTDGLKMIMPGLAKKAWEWQFMNASIDLIRGENLPNKKEYYLSDSQNFFAQQASTALKNLVTSFEKLSKSHLFGIYIPTISTGLNEVLSHYHFTTIPSSGMMYAWDTNKSFNKIDEFVTKTIRITDSIGDIVLEQNNHNHINISTLPVGDYQLMIAYKVSIPRHYKEYIKQLEQQHNITLTPREHSILSLAPTTGTDGVQRLWESKSQLYYPSHIEVTNITGDNQHKFFSTPFGRGLDYTILAQEDNTTHQLFINFTKHE